MAEFDDDDLAAIIDEDEDFEKSIQELAPDSSKETSKVRSKLFSLSFYVAFFKERERKLPCFTKRLNVYCTELI